MRVSTGTYLAALLLAAGSLSACGGGNGGGAQTTTISGNVSARTASLGRPLPRDGDGGGWLSRMLGTVYAQLFGLVGTAYAHNGVNGLNVCLEQCRSGVDGSAGCADAVPLSLCTVTDGTGSFTLRGGFGGDLCVSLTDPDDPGFRARRCMAAVEQGDTVRLQDMSCRDSDGVCDCQEIRTREQDRDRDRTRTGMP